MQSVNFLTVWRLLTFILLESCETNTRILERTNKYFLTVWYFVHSALAFKVLAILFSHKFIARLIHLCAVATNWKEDIASYKPFCSQQCCQGEGTREWMGERTKKKELFPITLLVFTCLLVSLSPRSIWSGKSSIKLGLLQILLGIQNK